MKAIAVDAPGQARVIEVPEPAPAAGDQALLQVRRVGPCGTDPNTFCGKNPMVTYPRVMGHEVAATVLESFDPSAKARDVTLSPYTACDKCPSCRRAGFTECVARRFP